MIRRHVLRLPARSVTLLVAEFPDKVVFKLEFVLGSFGDASQLVPWLTHILAQYNRDGRPLFIGDPFSGRVTTTLHGDAVNWLQP